MSSPIFSIACGCGLLVLGGVLVGLPTPQPLSSSPSQESWVTSSLPSSSSRWSEPAHRGIPSLPHLARKALSHYFTTGEVLALPQPVEVEWQRAAGVFVTLSHQGKTRGCWGSLTPIAPDLGTATIRAAIAAATRDGRYPPLQASELPEISIQVAIVQEILPIASVHEMDPTRFGLWVRSGSQAAVVLAGEALTPEWQLATARRWAGISESAGVELFRVKTQMLYEF
ncbi:MAG: AMMECR1 domain-containing protein [Cyanobacteriota bacterium]|nr:AMMECR1 domain-containing protein [Cyanobacteriota bacterium]